MKSVARAQGQIPIPKRLPERLSIRPGTILDSREEADTLIAEPEETTGALERWRASLSRHRRTDDVIRAQGGHR